MCVCVALSHVCLLLLLCVCERVFCVSVHACVCVDVDGWVRWRFFFATSNLKSVCSLSLNILLVYLCVYWFVCVVLIPTQQHSVSGYFFAQMLLLLCFCWCARSFPEILTVWWFAIVLSTLAHHSQKRGNNGHGEPFRRRKCDAGGQTEVDQSFFFCFVLVLSKKQQHRHFIQSFR